MSPTLRSDRRADPHLRDADGGIVSRPELVDRLQRARRVTQVSASPGSGKTTLVQSWIRESGIAGSAAWVSIVGERRNLTAPVNMRASDLRPPDLVMALIEELQVTHNFEVRFPSNNQHALDMLFALQHFYLAYADVDDAAREAPGVSAAGAVA